MFLLFFLTPPLKIFVRNMVDADTTLARFMKGYQIKKDCGPLRPHDFIFIFIASIFVLLYFSAKIILFLDS